MTLWETQRETVIRLVKETRAVSWWIDRQIEKGKTNEEIERELPVAVAFITGKITLEDLHEAQAAQAQGQEGEGASGSPGPAQGGSSG
jgi:hypothetical protein